MPKARVNEKDGRTMAPSASYKELMSTRSLLLVASSALALSFALPGCAEHKVPGSMPPFDAWPTGSTQADARVADK